MRASFGSDPPVYTMQKQIGSELERVKNDPKVPSRSVRGPEMGRIYEIMCKRKA